VVAGTEQHVWHWLHRTHPEIVDPAPKGSDVPTKARLRRATLEAWMAARPSRDDLIADLERAGLACSPIETLQDALRGPFGRERGVVARVDDRRGGERDVVDTPYRFSRTPSGVRGPAPTRGEHNRAILAELLGLGEARIAALEAAGVLQTGTPDEL
jgi:crotonobetainyl-CoA:carnitine CoA-transferase CaiB-like acyl-CoA transferase